MLTGLWRGLLRARQPLPQPVLRSLALLHSYLLLRPLTALGQHEARLCLCKWSGVGAGQQTPHQSATEPVCGQRRCMAPRCPAPHARCCHPFKSPAQLASAAAVLQNAARLLVRISASLEAFPAHAAAILTSTVVECHRQVLPICCTPGCPHCSVASKTRHLA